MKHRKEDIMEFDCIVILTWEMGVSCKLCS